MGQAPSSSALALPTQLPLVSPSAEPTPFKLRSAICSEGFVIAPNGSETKPQYTHRQFELLVSGSSPRPWPEYHIHVQHIVRGASWRSSHHPLCVSMEERPSVEFRTCKTGSGTFNASLWLLVPGTVPRSPPKAIVPRSDNMSEQLAFATSALERGINVCAPRLRFSKTLLGDLCEKSVAAAKGPPSSPRVGVLELVWSKHFTTSVHAQTSADEWRAIGTAFLTAVARLPQPFAIVEAGNLCGATTIMLAILKRRWCPTCPLYSLDPGAYRRDVGQPYSCARDALAWSGLLEEVELLDDISGVLSVETPVGFVYLDDGKARVCNDPLMAYLNAKMMLDAVVAVDDAWAPAPDDKNTKGERNTVAFLHM